MTSQAPAVATSDEPVQIETVESHAQEWDAYVNARLWTPPVVAADAPSLVGARATGSHLWAWRDVFTKSFGHRSIYLAARGRDGAIAGILPLTLIRSRMFGTTLTSLPFLNYGGVVADSPVVARALVDTAVSTARDAGCGYVELRHFERQFDDLPCKQHKVTMRLPLEVGMWDRLDRKVRNQVRKAEKSNLVATRGGAELLPEFYAVFARNMRDLGTPVYSRRFFEHVMAAFPDHTRCVVVRLDRQPVAAALTFRSAGTIEVPWASSIRDFNALCPNHLLYWTILDSAVAEGCDTLDFGRSTPDEGTFKFKQQWGAEPVPLHWEYAGLAGRPMPDQSPKNPKFRMAIATWKRLPLRIANVVGPRIVGGIP